MRGVLLVLAALACARCADPVGGRDRMLSLLDDIEARTQDENEYIGDGQVRALEARLAALPPGAPVTERVGLHGELGTALLHVGRESDAVRHLAEARGLMEGAPAGYPAGARTEILFELGVAWLRLGETQNCCRRWTPDSCVLPIRGDGIHTRPEGSREASRCFRKVLEATSRASPRHYQALWLLNIAAMTLGEYPNGVPEAYRIPPTAFENETRFPRFRNVAADAGVDTFSLSGGAVAEDFDGDGDLDLMVSTWDTRGQLRFFANRGDGGFDDRTEAAGLTGQRGGLNLVHADYDNDGDFDVLVLRGAWLGARGRHPNSLLRNRGDGTFQDVTFAAGLGEVHYPTQTAGWADYDRDGDLDLYVGNESDARLRAPGQLFRNNGDGTFADVAEQAGVTNFAFAKGVTWGDFDGDAWPDLYVSNLGGQNRLYKNLGSGRFKDVALVRGVAGPRDSLPAWFWDYDNDGVLDLYVPNYSVSAGPLARAALGLDPGVPPSRLYRGTGRGRFRDVAGDVGLDRPGFAMGSNFGDLDNDGFPDFYLGTGAPPYEDLMPNLMFLNRGGERFDDVSYAGGFAHLQKGHAVVFADLDNDGDQDVFEQMGGAYAGDAFKDALYENPGFGRDWIGVRLVGKTSNRGALGARIRVVLRDRSVYAHVDGGGSFGGNAFRQTIGLGAGARIERVEVFWPTTGRTQVVTGLPRNRYVRIVEGEDGWAPLPAPAFRIGAHRE